MARRPVGSYNLPGEPDHNDERTIDMAETDRTSGTSPTEPSILREVSPTMAEVIAHPAAGSLVSAPADETGFPKSLAHSLSHELLQVLALLRGASDAASSVGDGEVDPGGLTDAAWRSETLIHLAENKIAAVVKAMDPHI